MNVLLSEHIFKNLVKDEISKSNPILNMYTKNGKKCFLNHRILWKKPVFEM